MIPPHDIDSKQISDSVAIKHGIAALLTTSADSEQRLFDAYNEQKERADYFEQMYNDKCKEVEQLKATIAAMQAVQPITNYNINRDYVAAQYLQ